MAAAVPLIVAAIPYVAPLITAGVTHFIWLFHHKKVVAQLTTQAKK